MFREILKYIEDYSITKILFNLFLISVLIVSILIMLVCAKSAYLYLVGS